MSAWTYSEPKETKDVQRIGVAFDAQMRIYEYVVIVSKLLEVSEYCIFGYGHTPEEAIEAAHKVTA